MPCKDTTAQVAVILDHQECVVGFDFSKITCQKTIGGGTGFEEWCRSRSVSDLMAMEFFDFVRILKIEGSESQFLLYLEWDAFHSAILQYLGKNEFLDPRRYQIESILYEENRVEIRQVIRPPTEMPRIKSCSQNARAQEESGT